MVKHWKQAAREIREYDEANAKNAIQPIMQSVDFL